MHFQAATVTKFTEPDVMVILQVALPTYSVSIQPLSSFIFAFICPPKHEFLSGLKFKISSTLAHLMCKTLYV